MANGAGKPKPAFFIAVLVVVAGLGALAYFQCKSKDKAAGGGGSDTVAQGDAGAGGGTNAPTGKTLEKPPAGPVTGLTAETYEYEPATTLSTVPATSSYKKLDNDRVVKFAVNVWAGWAPIVWANQGNKAGKKWKDANGKDFQVELVLIDKIEDMGNTVAAGEVHIGWATVDMLPLVIERLKKDQRTMPRVYQQIDWSNGGDGIVARDAIKNVADLRGKRVVLAQNSPSHYFLLNMLNNGGVDPTEVKMEFTKDAFQAAQAFNQTPDIAACVSWAPDIYKLKDAPGNHMLVSTQTANKLIADVWFARADFARDNPEIIEGLVTGILDGVEELASDDNKTKVGDMMDKFYGLKAGTGKDMLGDAHWTNYAENKDFFLVSNNPTNFANTYNSAVELYRRARVVNQDVGFEKIMDFSVAKKLEKVEKYAKQKNTYDMKFEPATASTIQAEKSVTDATMTVNFYPNSDDIFYKVPAPNGSGEVYYDGKIMYTIDQIAKIAGQYATARIAIEGHTDASMKGQVDASLVKELAQKRAEAVKKGVLAKYPKLDKNQMVATGIGWDKPLIPETETDPVKLDQIRARNRRVVIKVIPAEK
jgi:NitT/TauT family transport system substrate-binding protein